MATVAKRRFIRADGPDKVTGSGRYTADLNLTGMLHAKFKFAGVSHGRITRLDTSKAEALPGVFAVATHADVPDVLYGDFVQDRYLFCKEYVRYEGDLVAAVAAITPEIAQQAVDLIEVDYEKLPVVNDLEAALAPDAPLVHADWASYGDTDGMVRDRNDASHSTIVKGDIEQGMRDADVVVKSRFVADGSHAAPIEPRAIVAQWSGDHVTIWTSTQVPFSARSGVMDTLELPASKVRIIVPLLGGGFGGKCGFHFEAHVAVLARKAARPVQARVLAPRGVPRSGPAPRGHGHRDRERREEGRHDHRAPRLPDHRQRRLHGRLGVLLGARGDARRTGRTRPRARTSTRTASTRTTSRPARCARPRRRRPAGRWSSTRTSWRPRSAWIRSSSAARTASTPATRARRGRSTCRSACRSASPTPPR